MQRRILQTNGQRPAAVPEAKRSVTGQNPSGATIDPLLGANARAMLKILLAKPSGEQMTEVAREIGIQSSKGLASINRQVKKAGGRLSSA